MEFESRLSQQMYMVTTTYNKINSIRLSETIFSIHENLKNSLIKKYFILLEVELPTDSIIQYDAYIKKETALDFTNIIKDEFLKLLEHEKVEIYLIKNRPTYKYMFDFCNTYSNIIWILSNSDIHFPQWNENKLKRLYNVDYDKEAFVLTRYNILSELSDEIRMNQKGIVIVHDNVKYRTQHETGSSIDSWIFKTPFDCNNINLNFEMGVVECDGRMNYQLSRVRKVTNPCLDIVTIHKHSNWSPKAYNIVMHEGHKYSRNDFNAKLERQGLKRCVIPFSKTKRKIAHVINPFKCPEDNPSYLYYAQPITFESMYKSMLYAHSCHVDVELFSINYPEDDEIVPSYFTKLPHLCKSTQTEFPDISTRKLPIIQEIFDTILRESDADYIIFSNSDIGVRKNFYTSVNKIIDEGKYRNFIINRCDDIPKFINERRITKDDLEYIYKQPGKTHPGKDCFVISRNVLERIDMNLMFTGYPPWGFTLHTLIEKLDKKTNLYENIRLTFHIGSDVIWKKEKKNAIALKNVELSKLCRVK